MLDKLEKIIVKILKVGVVAVLFVPLIYSSATIFPFIFPKSLAFRFLLDLLLAPYLCLILMNPGYRPARSKVLSAIGIFFGIEIFATILGVDPLRSFWGNHERMMGLYMYAHIILFFLITVSVYRTKKDWREFVAYVIFAGGIVTAVGYIQFFSKSFLHEVRGGRIFGTFGNSIYLAAYLLFQIYLLLWYALGVKDWRARAACFVLLALEIIAFGLTRTRGAFIAFIVSCSIFLLIIGWRSLKSRPRLAAGAIALPVLFIIFLAIFWQSPVVRKNKILLPLTQLNFHEVTAQTRLLNWKVGMHAGLSRPLLGWGPENYYTAFNKFYDPKFLGYSSYETWQDHAHNFLIDTFVESGIFGLIAFLSIFAFAFLEFLKLFKKQEEWWEGAIFISLLVAYFVQNIFAFDTLGVWMMVYVVLGYAHIRSTETKAALLEEPRQSMFIRLNPAVRLSVLLGIAVTSISVAFLTNVVPFSVSAQTIRAGSAFGSDPQLANSMLVEALDRSSPYKAESREEYGKIVSAILQNSRSLTRDDASRMMTRVLGEYKKNLAAHPRDVYFHINTAQWFMMMGSILDPQYFLDAEELLLRVLELSPKRQQIHFMLVKLYLFRGRAEEAVTMAKQAVDLNPKVPKSHWHYGEALSAVGKLEEGYKEMRSALQYDFGTPYTNWFPPEMNLYISLAEKFDKSEAAWWRGVLAYSQADYKSAYENMKKAADAGYSPVITDYVFQYFSAAETVGKPIMDEVFVQRMDKIHSGGPDFKIQLGRIMIARGERERAREILLSTAEKFPRAEKRIQVLLDEIETKSK